MSHYSVILLSLTAIFMGGWAQYPDCSYTCTTMVGTQTFKASPAGNGTNEYVCDTSPESNCTRFSKNADPQNVLNCICFDNWEECGAEYVKWTRMYKGNEDMGYSAMSTDFYYVDPNSGCVNFNCTTIDPTYAGGKWCNIYTPMRSPSIPISQPQVDKYAV